MEKTSLRSEFTLKQFSLIHHSVILFTISHWQLNKSLPGIVYLIYRTLVAAIFIVTFCIILQPEDLPDYIKYFTMWGYMLCGFQLILAFVLQFFAVIYSRGLKKFAILKIILKLYPFYWIVQATSTSSGFLITIIFWIFLWENNKMLTANNFIVHANNSILLLVDLMVMGHPVRILHAIYPLLFELAYVIFNISYYFYDINRGGIGYIYVIVDWGKPLAASLVVLGISFLMILLHLLTYGIHIIKILIYAKFYTKSIESTTENPTIGIEYPS